MEQLNNLALEIGGHFWNVVIYLGIFLALYLCIRTKFAQFRLFPSAVKLVKDRIKSKEKIDGVSGFQAFCVTLGGCIGTGNVAGVAMAIIVGGPGVVVWMWLIALLGACTSFVENTLAQVYKVKEGGIFRGGPAYYMEKGLGKRWLGKIYALVMIVSLGFALVGLQTNTIVLSIGAAFKIPVWVTALVVSILIALVIFGGV
ncbi:MAG: sodium:alanine symporter family protein, partial [Clostridia bacterium]|nr:sodium:alanine symporter family protein [Clostridia bacterium]